MLYDISGLSTVQGWFVSAPLAGTGQISYHADMCVSIWEINPVWDGVFEPTGPPTFCASSQLIHRAKRGRIVIDLNRELHRGII